jgi:endogenous inhibitor of DNA gyrase (YacG/DUF329 family)
MMSTVVQAKCPKCKAVVSVEDERTAEPVTCAGCQQMFIPAEAIASDNKKFEMMMYIGMLVVGVGLLIFMAATGRLKPPQPDAAEAPAAVEQEPAEQ